MGRQMLKQRIELDDGRLLGVRRWPGRHNGLGPLVLLHGLLDSSAGWKSTANASDREMIALDLPGFGRSDLPRAATVQAMADDVIAALDQLGVSDFALVGHSLGGATSSLIAKTAPDRINRLALLAPAGYGPLPAAQVADHRLGQLALTAAPLVLANPVLVGIGYSALVSNRRVPDPALLGRLMANAHHCLPGVRMATRALARISEGGGKLAQGVHPYTGPVSAIWGEHDQLVPLSHLDGIRRAHPDAEISVWEKVGHHPQHEHPKRLLETIHAFDLELVAA